MGVSHTVSNIGQTIGNAIPKRVRETALLRGFGLMKVPMILYCSPVVEELDAKACRVRIPLIYRTRNHFRSMYFGVLAVGADCTGGLAAMYHIRESGENVSLLFKDFKAEFLKRAEGDVVFSCGEGDIIKGVVQDAVRTGERINRTLNITATVPKLSPDPVARFEITLSLKKAK